MNRTRQFVHDLLCGFLIAAAFIGVASVARADTCAYPDPSPCATSTTSEPPPVELHTQTRDDSLPFTGGDAVKLVVIGITAVFMGWGLHTIFSKPREKKK